MMSVYKTRMQWNVTREDKPANFRQLSTSFHFMLSCRSVKFTQSTVFYCGTIIGSDQSRRVTEPQNCRNREIKREIKREICDWNRRCSFREILITSLFLVLPESLINKNQESPRSGSLLQSFYKDKKTEPQPAILQEKAVHGTIINMIV